MLYIRAGKKVPKNCINDGGVTSNIISSAVKFTYNFFYLLRKNIDYQVNYNSNTNVFFKVGSENSLKKGNLWLDYLVEFGEVAPPS